jgi:DNA repair protein RecO (recombination protein O)
VDALATMPLRESEAIILRSYSLGEADRLVSFLGRSVGRMRGVAQGARRPKSRFGASLELLTHVRMWFYERETRDLVRISQCEVQESFLDVQRDYECGLALSLLSEVTEAILPEREASDPVFRLVLLAARSIKQSGAPGPALTYFTLWMVKLGGWLPDLGRCAKCGASLEQGAHGSAARPVLVCGKCRVPGLRNISAASLATGRRMLEKKLEAVAAASIATADLDRYLLDVLEHHAEKKFHTRKMMESHA